MAAVMVNKSDRSVRQWRSDMTSNGGALLESKQGKYSRSGVLWQSEHLNKTTPTGMSLVKH